MKIVLANFGQSTLAKASEDTFCYFVFNRSEK